MFLKRSTFIPTFIGLLAILTIMIAGCGNTTKDQVNISNQDHSKALTFSWSGDIGDLNPHTYFPNQWFSQAMVYESLVYYGEGGELKPWLAQSWDVSKDGKEYVFHLRKDVTFSDGSLFNATIVKKNFDTVLANAPQHEWMELINQIKSTEVVDEFTFKLNLKKPYYPTLQELTYIRPLRFVGEAAFPDSQNTFKDGLKAPIGTGPWVLSEYTKNEKAVFTRNEKYWGAKPKVDKVIVKVIPDGESRVLAFEKKEIDLIFGNGVISQDSFRFLKDSGKYETKLSEPTATRALLFNTNREALKDRKLRLAIQHAFNKQAVIDHIFYGTERKADTLFAPTIPYTKIDVKPYEHDEEKAKQLLDEAGWKQVNGKPFREKDGETLQLELMFISSDNIQKAIAEYVQGEFSKLGIDIKLTSKEEENFWATASEGSFDLLFTASWGVPFDPHSYLSAITTPSEGGSPDYKALLGLPDKKELDGKIKGVLVSTDEAHRMKLYKDILTTLHEQAAYLPISYQSNIAVYHKNMSGVNFLPQEYEVPFTTIDFK
ncbi:nickel ABC transporter substrate-binding protein [Brevibacillus laterosporus]|uniref:nickel ABC transporter substrate-binding protein n=1 Tax=Brevibacillus laterosporus TaxID=1465 RepID=UPI0003739715|nr:nickel ABC transporter substrate-binding protein [Brevibacillus laterosporus]ATO47703.1 nickel ABC transporter, nickel/metallophore periplasmic binding protein [Brevibacillus laterosporus DSM 25]MBG9804780.1 nickel ABC transporter substrate-binding protein [Brevibacillus laterosporus]MED2002561.1 nickel ABC transporter substrate-binding protein [Brevibacillus laterosporus]MED4761954.1 nickel ABC transporter substrate-binding protein [Brevibacillus laterosporus]TPH23004.1 nickel ABC transpor